MEKDNKKTGDNGRQPDETGTLSLSLPNNEKEAAATGELEKMLHEIQKKGEEKKTHAKSAKTPHQDIKRTQALFEFEKKQNDFYIKAVAEAQITFTDVKKNITAEERSAIRNAFHTAEKKSLAAFHTQLSTTDYKDTAHNIALDTNGHIKISPPFQTKEEEDKFLEIYLKFRNDPKTIQMLNETAQKEINQFAEKKWPNAAERPTFKLTYNQSNQNKDALREKLFGNAKKPLENSVHIGEEENRIVQPLTEQFKNQATENSLRKNNASRTAEQMKQQYKGKNKDMDDTSPNEATTPKL